MVHAPVHALPQAQLGFLRERPSPARIAAFTGVIALHAAALALLMLPMAAPEPGPAKVDTTDVIFLPPHKKPLVVPVAPQRDPPKQPRRVTTRPVAPTPPQPPVLVEAGEAAPPIDVPPSEEVTSIEPIDTGPLAMERLDYASAPPPPYPPEAARRRLEGTVLLQVLVDVDGRPLEVLVQRSSGHRALDEAARKFVLKRWLFKPAVRDGQPVQAIGLVPVKFAMR
jgi:protein TonB